MNEDLRHLVHDRLSSKGLWEKNWSGLVLAACYGRKAIDDLLDSAKTTTTSPAPSKPQSPTGAYLTSLTVQGFRGIGPKQTLSASVSL